MSYVMDHATVAAQATESARAGFIRRTYAHLAGAILAFVGLEVLLFQIVAPDRAAMTNLVMRMFGGPGMLILMVAFIGFGWLAQSWAASNTSRGIQYLGLGVYVVL